MSKVAFIVGHLSMGGLEKVTVHMANELIKNNDVDLVILSENSTFYEINNKVNVIEGNIKYSYFKKVIRRIYRKFNPVVNLIFSKEIKYLKSLVLKNKYTTIIAVDGQNAMIVNEVHEQLKGIYHFNFISWLHNNYDTYFNNYYAKYKKDLYNALNKSAYVVTLTKSDQEAYSQCNENTITIYNPITISAKNTSDLVKKEILFVARLVKEHKGLDYLIKISKKLKGTDWIIRVLGDGVDKKWLEHQIMINDLNDVLLLQGSVKQNIEQYYEAASIFISTSKWEGLPLVMIEAISSGLPVVSFNHTGAAEILGENEYGIVVNMGDIDSFWNELNSLMNSYEKRKEWSQKSIIRSNDFTLESIQGLWNKIIS